MKSVSYLQVGTAAIALFLSCVVAGCAATEGESCRLSSDCSGGLVCSDALCVTPEALRSAMNPDTVAGADSGGSDVVVPRSDAAPVAVTHPCGDQPYQIQVLDCAPAKGVFDSAAAPCMEPTSKHRVRSVVIDDVGGLGPLSTVANSYIAAEIGGDEPSINIELWRDGTFGLNCPGPHAWVTRTEDIGDDCTATYQGRFPITIIGDAIAVVEDAVFDLTTGKVTGTVDRQALADQLPEDLQPVVDNLVVLDVDTDGDGIMDRASASLTVCF
ncbi:MAG: hypothetical protein ACI9OJ_003779 [Myxococcota bacterium]|jgi:hypothetical protein